MGWALINEAQWYPEISKEEGNNRTKNIDKSATEDIENENDEFSENFETGVLSEVVVDKYHIVPEK